MLNKAEIFFTKTESKESIAKSSRMILI